MEIKVDAEDLRNLYWILKWYKDEYPDADLPKELAGFDPARGSDSMGRIMGELLRTENLLPDTEKGYQT